MELKKKPEKSCGPYPPSCTAATPPCGSEAEIHRCGDLPFEKRMPCQLHNETCCGTKASAGLLYTIKTLENLAFPRVLWRRRWDSNPRYLAVHLISSQARYDHFDTPPCNSYSIFKVYDHRIAHHFEGDGGKIFDSHLLKSSYIFAPSIPVIPRFLRFPA